MSNFLPSAALILGGAILFAIAPAAQVLFEMDREVDTISATANIVEGISGVAIIARVDTGARATSLHCLEEDLVIENGSTDMPENIGKRARLCIHNKEGDSTWIDTRIDSYIEVRNAEHVELRYCVVLPLSYGGFQKPTVVNLNDRSSMSYRMLLGRNFLEGNFLVDVSQQGPGGY